MTPPEIAHVANVLAACAVVFMGAVWTAAFAWAVRH